MRTLALLLATVFFAGICSAADPVALTATASATAATAADKAMDHKSMDHKPMDHKAK